MKKILGSILTIVAVSVLSACMFAGCATRGTYAYDSPKKYAAGSGSVSSAGISEISVDWIDGEISVLAEDTDKISFTEQTTETNSDYFLRYAVMGGELKVKFQKSGTKNKDGLSKNLTITVPKTLTLRELDIESVSGDIGVVGINADIIDIESVSGDINLTENQARKLSVENVSGDVTLLQPALKTDLETVSGDISVLFDSADFRVRFETKSGKIKNLCGAAQSGKNYSMGNGDIVVEAETVSGDLTIDVK